jgi:ATP-dependent exoDNAse (exonuclease V) beta subunit
MPTTIINASAGSGKTYRLAVAYLQALLQPLPDGSPTLPQSVLATTFTRAAASEILERVLRRLALAVLSDEELQRLLLDIDRPDLQRDDLVRLLESVCQVLPQLQVGTIDGLFARIVRVMGLDLGFPHAWSVADETRADELALEAADRMVSGEDVEDFQEQLRRYAQFNPGLRLRKALVDLLEDNRFNLLDVPVPEEKTVLAEPERLEVPERDQLIAALTAFDIPRTKAGKSNAIWLKALEQIKVLVQGEPMLITILKGSALVRAVGREDGNFGKIEVPASLREILGPLVTRARDDLRRLHEARLPALAMLAQRFHRLRREVAYASAAYTFREIETAVWTLPPHVTMGDLYFRLDGQIQHVLLDEFQDTSLSQFRFLWPIIEEVRSQGRLFFAVGDSKQSIYGWRGADRRLLDRLPEWLDPQHQDRQLTHLQVADNRRSSPAVLRAINRIFENLDRAVCLDPETYKEAEKQQRAEVRRKAAALFIAGYREHTAVGDNRYLAGRVRLLINDSDLEPEDEDSPDEIEIILRAVQQHLNEDPQREIAILCRRHKLMPSILAGLRMRGIAASGEGGNPVTDSVAVETVLSMLTWLDHPGHSLAREQVRLSGAGAVFGFENSTHEHVLSRQWHIAIMRRGLAAVLTDWVRHDTFRRLSAMHDQVRTEQLVELAREWDAAGGGRLSAFVEKVRNQRVDNPASSRVRVMTIHGSKGLEFEAVILADLEAGGGGREGPRLAVTMTEPGTAPTVVLLPKADEVELLDLQEDYDRFQQGKFEEDLSVLYVALTRAKSYLDVVLPTDDKMKPSLSAIIREKWGHEERGEHLIDQCAAQAVSTVKSSANSAGRDSGLGDVATHLDIAGFHSVPNRMEAITPSGQEGGGVVKLGLMLKSGNAQALERGTAVHALLSRIEWIETLPALSDWIRSVSAQEANPEACRIAARELYPRLRNAKDPLAKVFTSDIWLERWKAEGVTGLEVWRERRFAAIIGRDLMNGSFDRVVLGLNVEGQRIRAQILDFKTDRIADEKEREERRCHYQPQIDAYVDALHRLTALPVGSIQAELVWVGNEI